jgi:prophage tail gpP-like protein
MSDRVVLTKIDDRVEVTASRTAIDADDFRIEVDGKVLGGWMSARVTAGIERCPRDFDFTTTEKFASDSNSIVCKPGQDCVVWLGKDKVVTGFVNRYRVSISARSHTISLSGRGLCQDLVDCAGEWPGQQITASSVLDVARKLIEPYADSGLTVRGDKGLSIGQPDSAVIPQLNLMLGETAWDVIERLCRISGLLAYEDADGALVLSRLEQTDAKGPTGWKAERAANGFREGVNVVSAAVTFADDGRYSEYQAYIFAFNPVLELDKVQNLIATYNDPGVKRHRRHITLLEQGHALAYENAKKRAAWEASRRWGRSMSVHVTTDSWRDKAGALYRPRTLVPVDLPSLKIVNQMWLISEVTYRKDVNGTACDLVLSPPEAFSVQPTLPSYGIPLELIEEMNRTRGRTTAKAG